MTNNTNVNLAGKLFAYIQHGVDVNENIAAQYRNSLIFIGDEQQIYVPAKNAYVGIGQSNFNSALNSISALQTELNELKNSTRSATVQRIYPQYSPYNYRNSGNDDVVNAAALGYLTGNVEISAIGDYDVTTHFAYNTHWVPKADGTFENSLVAYNGRTSTSTDNATSGIRITYISEFDWDTDPATGLLYRKPTTQRLVIDDTQTWSYMTSAYAYTLGFSREYTNAQVEALYHDILGIGETVMVPVTYSSMFIIDPTDGSHDFIGGTYYYWNGAGSVDMHADAAGWATLVGEPVSGTQYYVQHTTYEGTYNMNIADGIQTLKEVAYILDQLSDGSLGTVTYLTKDEWDADNGLNLDNVTPTGLNSYEISSGAYYRVYTNGHPTTNKSKYGYWINTGNPENLGIQIAYSIAGNKADIEDLHDHVELAEQGKTTLRSFAADATDMITVSTITNKTGLEVTDTLQSLPNGINTGTYNVGDTRLVLGLSLASTYIYTNNTTDYAAVTIDGVEYYGTYQKVNMTDVAGKAVAANTYYRKNGNVFEPVEQGTAPDIDDILENQTQWYTNANSIRREFVNDKFHELTQVEYANLANDVTLYTYDSTTKEYTSVGTKATSGFETYAAGRYIRTDVGANNVVHANTTEGVNKIATTAWTIALVDDKNTEIENNLENIKELAYLYTDAKVDALDWKMAYSDFNWADAHAAMPSVVTDAPSDYVEGSDAYKAAEAAAREAWVDAITTYANNTAGGQAREDDYRFTYAYLTNKIRSQYISNIVEEDGIVKVVETNELPTDMLEMHTEVWGNQDSSTAKSFTAIVLGAIDYTEAGLVDGTDLEKLFYAINRQDKHQVFYTDGSTQTYKKVADTAAGHTNRTTNDYVYNAETGEYVQASAEQVSAWNRNEIANGVHTSPYYTQLYELELAYYEVDLATIQVSGSNITGFEYAKYDNNGAPTTWTGETTPQFYVIDNTPAVSNKYITGSVQHYSYDVVGGEGQNKISLTTHITYLEDATPTNTGLVDAYDVASFIDNMCEWVDLSASINDTVLLNRDAFYDVYEFDTVPTSSSHADGSVTGNYYILATSGTDRYVAKSDAITYRAFGKNSVGTVVPYGDTNMVSGSEFWSFVDGSDNRINAYTRNQNASTNALNLTLTKYGA